MIPPSGKHFVTRSSKLRRNSQKKGHTSAFFAQSPMASSLLCCHIISEVYLSICFENRILCYLVAKIILSVWLRDKSYSNGSGDEGLLRFHQIEALGGNCTNAKDKKIKANTNGKKNVIDKINFSATISRHEAAPELSDATLLPVPVQLPVTQRSRAGARPLCDSRRSLLTNVKPGKPAFRKGSVTGVSSKNICSAWEVPAGRQAASTAFLSTPTAFGGCWPEPERPNRASYCSRIS